MKCIRKHDAVEVLRVTNEVAKSMVENDGYHYTTKSKYERYILSLQGKTYLTPGIGRESKYKPSHNKAFTKGNRQFIHKVRVSDKSIPKTITIKVPIRDGKVVNKVITTCLTGKLIKKAKLSYMQVDAKGCKGETVTTSVISDISIENKQSITTGTHNKYSREFVNKIEKQIRLQNNGIYSRRQKFPLLVGMEKEIAFVQITNPEYKEKLVVRTVPLNVGLTKQQIEEKKEERLQILAQRREEQESKVIEEVKEKTPKKKWLHPINGKRPKKSILENYYRN